MRGNPKDGEECAGCPENSLGKIKRNVSYNVEGYNVRTCECEITVVCIVKVLLKLSWKLKNYLCMLSEVLCRMS